MKNFRLGLPLTFLFLLCLSSPARSLGQKIFLCLRLAGTLLCQKQGWHTPSPPCLFAFTFPLAVLTLRPAFSSLRQAVHFRHYTDAMEI